VTWKCVGHCCCWAHSRSSGFKSTATSFAFSYRVGRPFLQELSLSLWRTGTTSTGCLVHLKIKLLELCSKTDRLTIVPLLATEALLHFSVGERGFVGELVHDLASRNSRLALVTANYRGLRSDLPFVTFADGVVVALDNKIRCTPRLLYRALAQVIGALLVCTVARDLLGCSFRHETPVE